MTAPRPPRAVLFDLDDTLFDHQSAARSALACVQGMHTCFQNRSFEDLEREHSRCLEDLHRLVIAGTLGIDDARVERFRRLFALYGVEAGDDLLQPTAAAYRQAYIDARAPMEGAKELLIAIKAMEPRVRIGIVTNNLLEEQRSKLRLCGFDEYVDALIVSEEAGVSKPDPAIFAIALSRLQCDAADAVMVGDSWTADVEGALASGIRPIWFNRTGGAAPRAGIAEITSLLPLDHVLDVIFGTGPEATRSHDVSVPPALIS